MTTLIIYIILLHLILIMCISIIFIQIKAKKKTNVFIVNMLETLVKAINNMRELDKIGAFLATDEVGYTFEQLLSIVNSLELIIKYEL